MKGLFQFVRAENGERSESFFIETQELARKLADKDSPINREDYVLFLAPEDAEKISTAPLITVETFLKMHEIHWKDDEVKEA